MNESIQPYFYQKIIKPSVFFYYFYHQDLRLKIPSFNLGKLFLEKAPVNLGSYLK